MFTDIEGSTRLLGELGVDAYRDALAEHRRVVRDACARYEGYEVDYEGDAFFYAFASAQQAVSAVSEAMVGLEGGPIRIRVGVHTGEPALDPPKYVGLDVHRAARIMSSAHGGQVVLSRETVELLPDGAFQLVDLGDHRFKDLGAPERVFQLGEGGYQRLKSLYRVTLPVPATPFLGREEELAAVVKLLADPGTRVLTLTGPGGTGKTRLALQAAAEASDGFVDGVTWVALAPLRDPALVLPTVAQALEVKERPDEELVATLARALLGKKALLLLDNLEHLLPQAARDVAALTTACPTLMLLVSSREWLQIAAEKVWPVPAMSESDGEQLFIERSHAAGVELEADEAVAELCRRLDELPLAIQLAAARTRSLSPAAILERLDQRLTLLTGGARDVDERQRTLEATIAWSYDLLSSEEQRVLRALSVFAGGCTLDAAEQIAAATLDSIESLLDKSLLRHRADQAGRGRYWMLESVRQYARRELEASGEAETVLRTHARYFGAQLGGQWFAARNFDEAAIAVLEADLDNGRAALANAFECGDGESASGLLIALQLAWLRAGRNREALAAVERYLSLDRSSFTVATRLEGDLAASEVLRFSGDPARARELKERCLDLARQHPTLELPHQSTTAGGKIASTLSDLSDLCLWTGDTETARRYAVEGLELRRTDGSPLGIAHALNALAIVEMVAGNRDRSSACLSEASELLESVGSAEAAAGRVAQAEVELLTGRPAVAIALLAEHLPALDLEADAMFTIYGLFTAMQVIAAHGHHREASALAGTVYVLLQETGNVMPPWDAERLETTSSESRAQRADLPNDNTAAPLPADAALALALDTLRELASEQEGVVTSPSEP